MTARSPGTRYPERTKRRARQLYADGWPKARISRHLNVGLGALRRWLSDLDGDEGGRRYDRDAILRDAAENPDSGGTLTRAQLRAKYGCSARYLSDLLTGKLKP